MGLFIVFLIMLMAVIYFVPSMVASGKKNALGIFILNLFLGWTMVFWVGALVWAVCSPKEVR